VVQGEISIATAVSTAVSAPSASLSVITKSASFDVPKTFANVDDDDDGFTFDQSSPFRLDMTPPGATAESRKTYSSSSSSSSSSLSKPVNTAANASARSIFPAIDDITTASSFASPIPMPKSHVLHDYVSGADYAENPMIPSCQGIYGEIARRIDSLLALSVPLSDSHPVKDDAREYLKILHSILTDQWNDSTSSSAVDKGDSDSSVTLSSQTECLILRLIRLLERCFTLPCSSSLSPSIDVDLSLVSLVMANLYAFACKPGKSVPRGQSRKYITHITYVHIYVYMPI
jgi:hypothetical protein